MKEAAKRERDGFYDVVTGAGPRQEKDDQNQDFWTARGQLLLTQGEGFSLRLIGDYAKQSLNCCVRLPSTVCTTYDDGR